MHIKRGLSTILIVCLLLILLPEQIFAEQAGYSYIDEKGTAQTTAEHVTVINNTWTGTELSSGWYIVEGSVSCRNLSCGKNVHLILADRSKLTVTGDTGHAGVEVPDSHYLAIYGQTTGTGRLIARGGSQGAGIGGGKESHAGIIKINGGTISASGGFDAAGIGCGGRGDDYTNDLHVLEVMINGGTVTATGGNHKDSVGSGGPGIGSGSSASTDAYVKGYIVIRGGTVTARGGNWEPGIRGSVTIDGGIVTAAGSDYSAGIELFSRDGEINIHGGFVTATGGKDYPGIGNFFFNSNSIISIDGGTVIAKGGTNADGIGCGNENKLKDKNGSPVPLNHGSIMISGGSVKAKMRSTPRSNARQDVFLTVVTLKSKSGTVASNATVSALSATLNSNSLAYGINGMQTDAEGKLYLYLPEDAVTSQISVGEQSYIGTAATTIRADTSKGTLVNDHDPPSVIRIMPNAPGAPQSGNIQISFDKAMHPDAGNVSLGGATFALGRATWSNDQRKYTIPYTDLLHDTEFTVTVSGFSDANGNRMTSEVKSSFTTVTQACASPPEITASESNKGTEIKVTCRAASNADGILHASLPDNIDSQIQQACSTKHMNLRIVINGFSDAAGLSLRIPSDMIASALHNQTGPLSISTPLGYFTFNEDALKSICEQAGSEITLQLTAVNPAFLSTKVKNLIGARPFYNFALKSGDTVISDLGSGKLTVELPYVSIQEEKSEHIVIYSISEGGESAVVPNCIYCPEINEIWFSVTHFSTYGIGLNDISFSDHSGQYATEIEFVAAHELMKGVGNDQFSPESGLTRAMFVTILHRLNGERTQYRTDFDDVPTNIWYTDGVAWAASKNIVNGIGNNKFAPTQFINREQLIAILFRYAQLTNPELTADKGDTLLFRDADQISAYALPAVRWATDNALLDSSEHAYLNPRGLATRAEAAVLLYRFLKFFGP